jgi:hypothetical protein
VRIKLQDHLANSIPSGYSGQTADETSNIAFWLRGSRLRAGSTTAAAGTLAKVS